MNLLQKKFLFRFVYIVVKFKFRTFFIIFFIKINICAKLYINRLHIRCSMTCFWYFLTISEVKVNICSIYFKILETFLLFLLVNSVQSNYLMIKLFIHSIFFSLNSKLMFYLLILYNLS